MTRFASKVGTEIPEGVSVMEARTMAGLDFEVKDVPLFVGAHRVPDAKGIERCDDGTYLGTVGLGYQSVQTNQVFELIEAMGQRVEVAGQLEGGRRIWAVTRAADPVDILPGDGVGRYNLYANGNNGNLSFRVMAINQRFVCGNKLARMLKLHEDVYCFRHSGNVTQKLFDAKQALITMNAAHQEIAAVLRALARKPFGHDDMRGVVDELIPLPEERKEKAVERRDRIMAAFEGGIGTEIPGVRGTAWAAVNAFTQVVDHEWSQTDTRAKVDRAFSSQLFGAGAALKSAAVTRIRELVAA